MKGESSCGQVIADRATLHIVGFRNKMKVKEVEERTQEQREERGSDDARIISKTYKVLCMLN